MIRTYTRKRPDHQVIEDVHSLCRLCLSKTEKPVPIFTQRTDDVCALAIRIMICVGLEVTKEECLPNIICANCLEMLEQYYSFRKTCEASYQKLKSHQAAIKMINYKEELKNNGSILKTTSPLLTQRLKIDKAKNIYFKLDSDGIVQICDDNNKNRFTKHTLVSIVKKPEPVGIQEYYNVLDVQNNTNTEIQPKSSSELQHNNTYENNKQCNKFNFSNEDVNIIQCDKQYVSIVKNIVKEETINSIDVCDTDIKQINNIDSNKNTVLRQYSYTVNNTIKDISNVEMNNIVIDSVASDVENNKTTDNIGITDGPTLVIDNNIFTENSELTEETHQGNLVINEVDGNEVAAGNAERFVIDHDEMEPLDTVLPEVLSTMLLDVGVLTRQGESLIVLDHTRTVELETVEGNQFMLEFIVEPAGQDHGGEVNVNAKEQRGTVRKSKSKKLSKEFKDMLLENKAICSICGKRFASSSGVKRHVWSVHARQRKHQCRVCERSFGQKEVMLRHELVHSEIRPFKCLSCPKSFTQRNALSTHARSHAPPNARALQLYRCPRCPKVFLYPSGLSRHTMTHSGRVFACSGCQKAFKDKSSLKRHMTNSGHGQVPLASAIQPAVNIQSDQTSS